MTDRHAAASWAPPGGGASSLPARDAAEDAARAAEAAARTAGVAVRELTDLTDLDALCRLYDAIWRPDPTNPPITTDLLRALAKSGNYVGGAFDDDRLVGACVAFFGPPAHAALHSHIAGVAPGVLGRNVGFALKLHQRAWALQRGASVVEWTFDPLVSRNAHFNIAKLGAAPIEYLTNFYGGMHDAINSGDESDRLLVRWDLSADRVVAACAGKAAAADAAAALASGAAMGVGRSPSGRPVVGPADAAVVVVAVPPDVESLRIADPALAKEWRLVVRDVLGTLLARGARVTGFDRAGWYVVTTDSSRVSPDIATPGEPQR